MGFFNIPSKHSILIVTGALKASAYGHLCYSFDLVGNDQRFFLYFSNFSGNLKHKMAYLKLIMMFCLLIALFETSLSGNY